MQHFPHAVQANRISSISRSIRAIVKVTPHPAFASRVGARRGELDFAPKLSALKEDHVWGAFVENVATSKRNHWVQRVGGNPNVKPSLDMVKSKALPEPFDARLVAMAERLMTRGGTGFEPCDTLCQLVAERAGVAAMVEMMLEATAIAILHNESEVHYDSDAKGWLATVTYGPSWDIARAIVCRASDADYAKAREIASKWRASRPVSRRMFADYLFPSEPAWANEDLDASLKEMATDHTFCRRAFSLLASANDPARVGAFVDQLADYELWSLMEQRACDVAVALPPADAMRVLCTLLEKSKRAGKGQLAVLGMAMCALEGEEMAHELAGLLLHAPIGPFAVEYFKRFPELARAVLPKVASGTSKAADAARSILAASASKDDVPLADASEIPSVLRETPWRKKKKPKAVKLDITTHVPTTIIWKDGEREKTIDARKGWYSNDLKEMTSGVLAHYEKLDRLRRPADVWVRWGTERGNYAVPATRSLEEWNENETATVYRGPLWFLAVHGDDALPGLFKRDAFGPSWNSEELFEAQLHAVGKESAAVAAHALARRKAWKKRANEWLVQHADVAAQALLPVALGADSASRKQAEAAVRAIARAHRDAVEKVAHALGGDAERAAMELVDRDPLTDLDVKGKLPPFVQPSSLPFVKTKSGKRLPDEAVEALLEILRSTSVDSPYAGLDAIKDGLDATALGELAWALVQAWILAGAKGTYEWIPYALAIIGDDSCARRLAPYVRDWARKDAKKAKLMVDILSAIGTPAALLHLAYVADKSRFEEAKTHARETLEQVAAAQGLTTDELADRTVPDLELDANGTATLDFGARKFTVTFDEGLHPVIQGEDGARLPAFPRATKTDDAALAKAASARFKGLKADAETVAQALLRRFEGAMVKNRSWSAPAFREYVVGHPLVTHLARRLVWSSGAGAFRVAEDGSFADANDAEYKLSGDATVTLPHPLVLGADAVAKWSRIVADYGVVQPFEQLGRATYSPSEDAAAQKLERFANKKSKPGPLMGSLDARGWQKWPDETSLSWAGKTLRTKSGGEASVSLSFSPGIDLANVAGSEEQVFAAPALRGAESFSQIHPVDYSEIVRDLEFLAH